MSSLIPHVFNMITPSILRSNITQPTLTPPPQPPPAQITPPATPLTRSVLSVSPSEIRVQEMEAKLGPDPGSDDAIVDATLKAEAKKSGPAQTVCDQKVEEPIEVEAKESKSAPKTDVTIVEDILEPEPEEPKKEPKAARKAKEAIIDEPLKSELIIAIVRQNFRNGVYKSIIKDMKSPISALNTILYCQKLEPEKRIAIQEYYDEAVSIYEVFENGEKDVSEFISQETWDSLMDGKVMRRNGLLP